MMDVSNVVMGSHLSISISGTARLQQQSGAAVPDSDTQTNAAQTVAEALKAASSPTLQAIEKALEAFSPSASLDGYQDGRRFYNGSGLYIDITA
jgi:hypothetical protein